MGSIGQDGEGAGEESADDLDEEEGAAQEGRDLEPAEDEGALVLVGGCPAIVVVAKVLVGSRGGGGGDGTGGVGIAIGTTVLAVAVAVAVAVRVAVRVVHFDIVALASFAFLLRVVTGGLLSGLRRREPIDFVWRLVMVASVFLAFLLWLAARLRASGSFLPLFKKLLGVRSVKNRRFSSRLGPLRKSISWPNGRNKLGYRKFQYLTMSDLWLLELPVPQKILTVRPGFGSKGDSID